MQHLLSTGYCYTVSVKVRAITDLSNIPVSIPGIEAGNRKRCLLNMNPECESVSNNAGRAKQRTKQKQRQYGKSDYNVSHMNVAQELLEPQNASSESSPFAVFVLHSTHRLLHCTLFSTHPLHPHGFCLCSVSY